MLDDMKRHALLLCSLGLFSTTSCKPSDPPNAGQITQSNIDDIMAQSETRGARSGDYYLRNNQATFIIQRPGHELSLGPFGGNLIDAALRGGTDNFGELIPVLAVGRTIRIDSMRVIADGSDGGPAIIETLGHDALNTYFNLMGLAPDLISFDADGQGLLYHDPEKTLGLDIRIVYSLGPDDTHLNIQYSFTNAGTERIGVPLALLIDARGNVKTFLPGDGFEAQGSKDISVENLQEILSHDHQTEQILLTTKDYGLAIVPRAIGDIQAPTNVGLQVPNIGTVLAIGVENLLEAASEPTFILNTNESVIFDLDVVLEASGASALAKGWQHLGYELDTYSACVTHETPGTPANTVQVGFYKTADNIAGFCTTGSDGCCSATLPKATYEAMAGDYFRPLSEQKALSENTVELVIQANTKLEVDIQIYNDLETTQTTALPCRLTLIGQRSTMEHKLVGPRALSDPGGKVARMVYLQTCKENIEVLPGRYLAIVTRGPQFSKFEEVLELSQGVSTTLTGAIHRASDAGDYAASDFHIHSIFSMDSLVPAKDRVISISAEGLDFWASTEHDVVVDFSPYIQALGLEDELLTIPGAEVTTFELGHFGAFPLIVDTQYANGGTPDWTYDVDQSYRPTMQDLFDVIHGQGGLVQVNHARSGGLAHSAYFSRAGLLFDESTKTPYNDIADHIVANEFLRYDKNIQYFSDDFDIIEVMNGVYTYVSGDMVYDSGLETEGHDWMSMLSSGRRVVAVGNSDTHTLGAYPGSPRTMVKGRSEGTSGLVANLKKGAAYVTTGPLLDVEVKDASGATASPGDVFTPSGETITLVIKAQTPEWFELNRVDVVSNVFFVDPSVNDKAPRLVEATPIEKELKTRNNGATYYSYEKEINISLDNPTFNGQDSWLIVRVAGTDTHLFPVIRGGGGTLNTAATSPEDFLSQRTGKHPFAFTNPIFLDLNEDGLWHNQQPL